MRVFRYIPKGSYFSELGVTNSNTWKLLWSLEGKPVASNWVPFSVKQEPNKPPPDLWMLGCLPVFNTKAMELLYDHLKSEVEALPINVLNKTSPMYLMHVLGDLDCLDAEHSTYDYFKDGSKGIILKYKFKPMCVKDRMIFRLRETLSAETLMTDVFCKLVKKHNLRGLIINESSLLDEFDIE
jgi:hypothetical protein